jgi:hypothetical protein
MRTYEDEAPRRSGSDDALPQFAPRYERPSDRRGRTPVDIITDALALLHQDIAEYAFAGFIGAIAAAFAAVVLSTGGIVGKGLIAPAVFGIAVIMYAQTCAAVRRAQDNLEPDAARAFFSVVARIHALFTPLTLPLALSAGAVLVTVGASRWMPSSVLTLGAIVVFAYCALASFQRALYIPALFARNVSFAEARALGVETMKKAYMLLVACFGIALAPAGLMALIALAAGFGALSTGVTAFVFVACIPLAAATASIVFEAVSPQVMQAPAPRPQRRSLEEQAIAQRVVRRGMR